VDGLAAHIKRSNASGGEHDQVAVEFVA